MPSSRKQCICQLCTCGRHMCLHRNRDTHLILGDGTVTEVSKRHLLEAKDKRRKQTEHYELANGGTQDISPTVDQINAQHVLASAASPVRSVYVEDKGNSQAYVENSGNRWSARQVPKRQSIRPLDHLKHEGEADFTTIHQLDYTKKASSEFTGSSSVHQTVADESPLGPWSQKQIPKTLPIKKPDSLILSGPLSLETTNKSDFTETVFQSKIAEDAQAEKTPRPRTSLKLSGQFQADSSYQRAFTPKHVEGVVKIKKGTSKSHLKPEGDMSFDTTSLDYRAAVSEKAKLESESDRGFVLKPKPAKPQSGIKIPEVPLQDETTAVTDYRRWNVGKPQKHKPADTLQLVDGSSEADENSPNFSSKVYANAEAKINDARWHVSRPVIRKPQNSIGPEGSFNFGSTNDVDYLSRRSRYSQSNLETVTERTEREQTETFPSQKQLVSTDIEQPTNIVNAQVSEAPVQRGTESVHIDDRQPIESVRAQTPPPQFVQEEHIVPQSARVYEPDIDIASQSGEQMEYVTWDQIRPKAIRPHSNLRQEGGMEFSTTNRSEFVQRPSERVKGIRPKTSTKVFEGDFDSTTMNQIMFSHDQGERPNPIRPRSNLHVENGQFASETTTGREYQQWEINRPSPIVHKPSLMQEGSIDFTTTNRTEFEEKHPEKVYPIRPSTTNRVSGDLDLTTTNQVMHGSFPIERVQKIVPQSNLRTSSGIFNSETTNRSQFQEYHIDRPKPIRPVSNLHQEGSMDFTTMNQLQFEEKPFEKVSQFRPQTSSKITGDFDGTTMNNLMYAAQPMQQKLQMIKPRGNLEAEKGTFASDTTNHLAYQQWQAAKPLAVTPRNNLQQQGDIDFTTTNQLQYAAKATERVSQIRPKTNPKVVGEFDGTTTNQMMYQNIPGEKAKAVRPKTNLKVERGDFGGETTNNAEFQTWGYEKPSPIKPHSSMRQEGTMNFTTTNNMQFEGKTAERVTQIRPTTTTKITGDFDGTTMNQIMFQNNPVEKVKGKRPSTNIHLEGGRFEDQTTAQREYQQWEIAKLDPIKPSGTLAQEGTMDFTTSNQREFGEKLITKSEQIRPHTSSPITGEFDGTTTNQVMYKGQTMDKVHDIRPTDNLRVESGEFTHETTTSKEYGYKSGGKQDLIIPKPNLSQEGDFDFVTSNQLQYHGQTQDKVSNMRPKTHTKTSDGKFYGTTMNQAMYQTPAMETVHSTRPQTNLRAEDGKFQSNTTASDAYQQWRTERPKAFQLASSLKQEGDMSFETTNSLEFKEKGFERVKQIRPKTTSKIEGEFEATTTNQAMFNQPEKLDRAKPIRHQNNLHLEPGKFSGETTTNREFRQWVKSENQIAVPKKKLQAAGIRTQKDRPNRRKEITSTPQKEANVNSKVSEHETGRAMGTSQDASASSNLNTSEEIRDHTSANDNAAAAVEAETSTSLKAETMEDLSSQRERMGMQRQSEAVTDAETEKGQDYKDISTMMADYGGRQTSKVKAIIPVGNLTPHGEMSFTTTQNDYCPQAMQGGDRKQAVKSQSKVKGEGSTEEARNENYEAWQLANGDTEYREALADRTQAITQKSKEEQSGDSLRQEQALRKKQQSTPSETPVKPMKRYKPADNLRIEHVPFDGTSTTRTEYKKWESRRSSSKRRGENLKQEGKMEFDTTSNDYSVTRNHQLSRENTRSKIKEELKKGTLTPTGNMEFSTTSKSSYVGATSVARARNLRPRSSLRFGVSDSSNQDVMPSSRSNPEISSTRENYEMTSTSRASYVGYAPGRRTQTNRPSTSQKVGEGAFEGQSTTRSSFTVPKETAMKSKTTKPENHNILDAKNGLTGKSTYTSSFENAKGHCPVLDLEAGRLPLTFNEEKNGHIFYAPRVQG